MASRLSRRTSFMDLPLETQQQVVGHMNRRDLFVFQRLSPHCFSLASAEIYRSLDLSLTNCGDDDRGAPGAHAADALQTILTSEHNYGQHVKRFRLAASDEGPTDPLLMTRLLWDSRSDSSKFLNTALLLMARKANVMETFCWDAPVELSGAVYQALHKVTSLKHLRIRLDVSPSPRMVIRQGLPPNHHPPPTLQQSLSHPNVFAPAPPSAMGATSIAPHPGPKLSNTKRKKAGSNGGSNYWANPRPFSGFKHLNSLALVGLANLDCLAEVAECIKASSANLKCLTLTLSTEMARRARKPAPVNPDLDEASDTELEDDEPLNDPMEEIPTANAHPPPPNEADIRKEKVAQESILARIFDLQSVAVEGKIIERKLTSGFPVVSTPRDSGAITKQVNKLMRSLIDPPTPSDTDRSTEENRLDQFKMIREVADLYIESQSLRKKFSKEPVKTPTLMTKPPASKPSNSLASDFKQPLMTEPPCVDQKWDSKLGSCWEPTSTALSGSTPSNGGQVPYTPSNALLSSNHPSLNNTSAAGDNKIPAGSHPLYGPWSVWGDLSHQNTPFVAPSQSVGFNGNFKTSTPSTPSSHHLLSQEFGQAKALQQQIAKQNQSVNQSYTSPQNLGSHANGPEAHISSLPYQTSQGNDADPYESNSLLSPDKSNPGGTHDINGGQETAKASVDALQNEATSVSKANHGSQKQKKADDAFIPVYTDPAGAFWRLPPVEVQHHFLEDPGPAPPRDAMDIDIDMEHPDEGAEELGEDQEILPEADEPDPASPRKRARFEITGIKSPERETALPSQVQSTTPADTISSDDAMQAYIRTTHGLQLESLTLEWVPLRASIVARALDMSVLKRLTLLEVGSQDMFWTLLGRLQCASPEISFKSIHTDNVSLPFMKFLTTFVGLEELFLHERSTKSADECTTNPPISITIIRQLALQKHADSLKRLMLRNERNDSWDVEVKTLQFLALKATKLRELGISLSMKIYHVFMQYFAAFKSLYALHLIALRSSDRSISLQSESLNFAVDSLSHCPEMKIKYIAIANSVVSLENRLKVFKDQLPLIMEKRRDKKGKGKAPLISSFNSLLDHYEDSAQDEAEEALAGIMAGESRLKIPRDFADLEHVKIFSKRIRMGKL